MNPNTVIRNGRGIGITELLNVQEIPVLLLFALVTQLGDVWLLFLLAGTVYVAGDELPQWGIDRRRGLFVIGLALTYVALIGVLKSIFALPRPPGAADPPMILWLPSALTGVVTDIATADPPGFPSGHALGSTMVWGGLALVLDRGTLRTRVGVASAIIALVSLSRLVIGVHYFVDVLVGAVLGVVALGTLYRTTDGGSKPGRILYVAVVVGIAGLLVNVTFDSVAAIGGAVGSWLI